MTTRRLSEFQVVFGVDSYHESRARALSLAPYLFRPRQPRLKTVQIRLKTKKKPKTVCLFVYQSAVYIL